MDGHDCLERVRSDEATALSRLGSDKYLIAVTGADLSTGPVLSAVARSAARAQDTFERWAESASDPVATALADAAETEADHYARVRDALPDGREVDAGTEEVPVVDAVAAALEASEGTVERVAAGLVGRPLVLDRAHLQTVSFFVNEADDARADLARDLREDAGEQLDDGLTLLETVCDGGDDWERARRAAGGVVADAYDDYAAALEAMGVDPKPVC